MAEAFDPYHRWLGISPKHQPPDRYRLLGIEQFESDPEVIRDGADRQMAHVRTYQLGECSDLSQKVLNELAAARACLLNPERKAAYDAELRERLGADSDSATPSVAPVPVTGIPVAAIPIPSPTHSKSQPWLVYAALGTGVLLLVVLLTNMMPNPDSDPGIDTIGNANGRFKNAGKTLSPPKLPKPPVDPPDPPDVRDPQVPPEPPAKNGSKPSSLGPAIAPVTPDTSTGKDEPDSPSVVEDTPTIPPPPSDAEGQLKSALAEAKSPEDFRAVAEKALHYVDQAILTGDGETAKALIAWAVAAAREAKDDALSKAATLRYLEVQVPLTEDVIEGAKKRLKTWKSTLGFQEKTSDGMVGLPGVAPPIAVSPFDARQAQFHQEAWARYLGVPVEQSNAIGMRFVLILPGEFMMGSPDSDPDARGNERPQHRVRITRPFYLGKYPVTQEQWEAVMGSNPSDFKGLKNPVETVSWDDCQKFVQSLNKMMDDRRWEFRLPTEAQWEYACRAGTDTRYSFGDDAGQLEEYAWYSGNSGGRTHPAGQKRANAWGLYDMHGNVWEWCADLNGSDYDANSLVSAPSGPVSGSGRMYRGGSWADYAGGCRSADRGRIRFDSRGNFLGLRLALVPADGQ